MDEGLTEVKIQPTKNHPDLLPTPISQRIIFPFYSRIADLFVFVQFYSRLALL